MRCIVYVCACVCVYVRAYMGACVGVCFCHIFPWIFSTKIPTLFIIDQISTMLFAVTSEAALHFLTYLFILCYIPVRVFTGTVTPDLVLTPSYHAVHDTNNVTPYYTNQHNNWIFFILANIPWSSVSCSCYTTAPSSHKECHFHIWIILFILSLSLAPPVRVAWRSTIILMSKWFVFACCLCFPVM